MSTGVPPPIKTPDWVGLPPGKQYELNVFKDNKKVETVLIKKACFVLGKVPSIVDYHLEHPSISRRHAALMVHKETGKVYVVDLKSSHGTRVNGNKLTPDRPTSVGSGEIKFGASTRLYTVTPLTGPTPGPVRTIVAASPAAGGATLEEHVQSTFVPKPNIAAISEKLKTMTPKARLLFLRKYHEEKAQEAKRAQAKATGIPISQPMVGKRDLYSGSLKLNSTTNTTDGEDLDGEADDGGPAKKAKTGPAPGPIGPAGPPTKPE